MTVLGWLLAGFLLVLAGLRFSKLDRLCALAVAASSGAPLVGLAAYPVLVVGLVANTPLAVAGAVLVALHLSDVVPLLRRPPAGTGRPVRVMALNTLYTEAIGAAVSAQVQAFQPDVVVLTEVTETLLRDLQLLDHPYSTVHAHHLARGSAIYARWPMRESGLRYVAGTPMSQAVLELPAVDGFPAGELHLRQVHTSAPIGSRHTGHWVAQLAELRAEIQASPVPAVTTGDFNAARGNRQFAALLGGRRKVVDALDGRGLAPTWPTGKRYPALLRLDHVLVGHEIGVVAARVLPDVGSDHLAVLVDLVVRSSSGAATPLSEPIPRALRAPRSSPTRPRTWDPRRMPSSADRRA